MLEMIKSQFSSDFEVSKIAFFIKFCGFFCYIMKIQDPSDDFIHKLCEKSIVLLFGISESELPFWLRVRAVGFTLDIIDCPYRICIKCSKTNHKISFSLILRFFSPPPKNCVFQREIYQLFHNNSKN